jgi:hypothetical protein
MSIFNRLFNKNLEVNEKQSAKEEGSTEVKQDGSRQSPPRADGARPNHSAATPEGKSGTMRPAAPPFDINAPAAQAQEAVEVSTSARVRSDARPVAKPTSPAAKTLVYATPPAPNPDPPPAPPAEKRAPAARAKTNITTARQGTPATSDAPAPQRARAVAAPPLPVAAAPARAPSAENVRSDAPWPELPKTGAEAPAAPTPPRGPARAEPAARAKPPAEPSATRELQIPLSAPQGTRSAQEPAGEVLSLELSLSPRQKPGQPAPRTKLESAPALDTTPAAPKVTVVDGASLQRDLDVAFGAMVEPNREIGAPRPPLVTESRSIAEVRELFTALAANHMRQVRDFMIGIKWGEAPREAILVCEAATQSLLRAAKEMDFTELAQSLEEYATTLKHIGSADAALSDAAASEALAASYAKLAAQLPSVFAFEGERGEREAVIVHSLLQQVPGVQKLTIDKIYAAGLTGLGMLLTAKPDEIAATTGITESVAASIVEKFRHYREEAKRLSDVKHDAERKRLAELCDALRQAHEQYEANAAGWSDEAHARKKELRQARIDALLQIKVLLARLGEVERLNEMERLPFGRKIDALQDYLRDTKTKPTG